MQRSSTEPTSDETPGEVSEEVRSSGLRTLAAGVVGGALAGLVLGLLDGLVVAAEFGRFHRGERLPAELYLHATALVTSIWWLFGIGFGLVLALAPLNIGPVRLLRGAWRFLRARGRDGGRLAAEGWSALIGLGLTVLALVPLCHHFITAYRNRLLAALALTVSLLGVAGVLFLVYLGIRQRLRGWFPAAAERGAILARVLGTRTVAGLVLTVALAGVLIVPLRFADTWAALPMRTPGWLLAGLLLTWITTDLLLRWRGRARAWTTLALLVGAGVLVGSSYASFGNDRADRRIAVAVTRYSPLSGRVLRPLARWHDADRDGYPGRFGGGDCNDRDRRIHPAAVEVPDNGVDEDCSGGDLHVVKEVLAAVRPAPLPRPAERPRVKLRQKWNVLFVLIDAMRADRAGWAGYRRKLTPHLDRLAKRGVVFERAYSCSNKTATVVPSLFTGRFTSELHRTGGHFVALYNSNVTVAELLQKAGYSTLASATHFYMRPGFGLAQGFDTWKTYYERNAAKMNRMPTSPTVTDNAIALLKRRAAAGSRKPFFLFTYYFDPHRRYLKHPKLADFGDSAMDRYDGEIRYVDEHLGRLLTYLEQKGLSKNTVVVVTADHGETFGEHGTHYHGRDLFEQEIRVPLLIYVPGLKPRRVAEPVSLIDLPRTLLDLLDVKVPKRWQGLSLVTRLVSDRRLPERVLYAEMVKGPKNPARRAIVHQNHKLIHDLMGNSFRLFDLRADPAERRNLVRQRPELSKKMRRLYSTFVATQLRPRRPSK